MTFLFAGARPLVLLRPVRPNLLPQLRSYAKKKAPAAKANAPAKPPRTLKSSAPSQFSKPTFTASGSTTTTAPIYTTLAERLGAAGRETILLAGYPKSFVRICYGVSALSFAWSIYDYRVNIMDPPEGLPYWVPRIHWFSLVTMSLVGIVAWYYPSRIVQKITAIPFRPSPNRPPTIKIRLYKRNPVPFLPEKKILVDNVNLLTLMEPLQPIRGAGGPEITPMTKLDPATRFVARLISLPFKVFRVAKDTITTANFVSLKLENGMLLSLPKDAWVWERRGIDKLFQSRKSYTN